MPKPEISHFFKLVQYLPTLELEMFISTVHWRQSQEYDRKNKKEEENKFLAILDKISNAMYFK
jgi:hypothetical protein